MRTVTDVNNGRNAIEGGLNDAQLYLYAGCSSCRKAEALLKERGVSFRRREFFKERFSMEELRDVLERAGMTAREALSTRSRPYAELGLAGRLLQEDELLGLMTEHPALLRRPIVIAGGRSVVGFDRGKLLALIGDDRAGDGTDRPE